MKEEEREGALQSMAAELEEVIKEILQKATDYLFAGELMRGSVSSKERANIHTLRTQFEAAIAACRSGDPSKINRLLMLIDETLEDGKSMTPKKSLQIYEIYNIIEEESLGKMEDILKKYGV